MDWLLSNGAFHQPLNVYQDSAVYVAVYHNQIDILSVLHAHKCDCNMPSKLTEMTLFLLFKRFISIFFIFYILFGRRNFVIIKVAYGGEGVCHFLHILFFSRISYFLVIPISNQNILISL